MKLLRMFNTCNIVSCFRALYSPILETSSILQPTRLASRALYIVIYIVYIVIYLKSPI